jgi:long-subunit acyl-CoA synthetase (AMP-forming)
LISKGYHHNNEASAKGFTKDGWYRTGDVMQFGENSDLLYVIGRTKVTFLLILICEHTPIDYLRTLSTTMD